MSRGNGQCTRQVTVLTPLTAASERLSKLLGGAALERVRAGSEAKAGASSLVGAAGGGDSNRGAVEATRPGGVGLSFRWGRPTNAVDLQDALDASAPTCVVVLGGPPEGALSEEDCGRGIGGTASATGLLADTQAIVLSGLLRQLCPDVRVVTELAELAHVSYVAGGRVNLNQRHAKVDEALEDCAAGDVSVNAAMDELYAAGRVVSTDSALDLLVAESFYAKGRLVFGW